MWSRTYSCAVNSVRMFLVTAISTGPRPDPKGLAGLRRRRWWGRRRAFPPGWPAPPPPRVLAALRRRRRWFPLGWLWPRAASGVGGARFVVAGPPPVGLAARVFSRRGYPNDESGHFGQSGGQDHNATCFGMISWKERTLKDASGHSLWQRPLPERWYRPLSMAAAISLMMRRALFLEAASQ